MKAVLTINRARRAAQVGFILLVFFMPVFDILRYDVAAKQLYIFGNEWTLGLRQDFYLDRSIGGAGSIAVHFLLNAILPWVTVLAVFPLLGVLLGRFFCGWLCPEGALFEIADYFTLKITGRRSLFRLKAVDPAVEPGNRLLYSVFFAIFVLTAGPVTGIFLTGYFIAPKTIWQQIATFSPSAGLKGGIIGVTAYMAVTSVLVRHIFCKYVCAAGLMQMMFGWISPVALRVRFARGDLSRCTDCRRCERVCFMGVKPRSPRRDANCVNCGACIEACRSELGKSRGLFDYEFGEAARAGADDHAGAQGRTELCRSKR